MSELDREKAFLRNRALCAKLLQKKPTPQREVSDNAKSWTLRNIGGKFYVDCRCPICGLRGLQYHTGRLNQLTLRFHERKRPDENGIFQTCPGSGQPLKQWPANVVCPDCGARCSPMRRRGPGRLKLHRHRKNRGSSTLCSQRTELPLAIDADGIYTINGEEG